MKKKLPTFHLFFYLAIFTSCNKNWNPDQQFQNEINILTESRNRINLDAELVAKENLTKFDLYLKQNIIVGMNKSDFDKIVGFNGEILVENFVDGKLWQMTRYMWRDVVAEKFDTSTPEYRLCAKNKPYFEVTTNEYRVISITWL